MLICDDKGMIHTHNKFKGDRANTSDYLYKIVKEETEGLDAVYEDYIMNLVGEDGLLILRMNRLIEFCGSINGRKLYTLVEKEP